MAETNPVDDAFVFENFSRPEDLKNIDDAVLEDIFFGSDDEGSGSASDSEAAEEEEEEEEEEQQVTPSSPSSSPSLPFPRTRLTGDALNAASFPLHSKLLELGLD